MERNFTCSALAETGRPAGRQWLLRARLAPDSLWAFVSYSAAAAAAVEEVKCTSAATQVTSFLLLAASLQ